MCYNKSKNRLKLTKTRRYSYIKKEKTSKNKIKDNILQLN